MDKTSVKVNSISFTQVRAKEVKHCIDCSYQTNKEDFRFYNALPRLPCVSTSFMKCNLPQKFNVFNNFANFHHFQGAI